MGGFLSKCVPCVRGKAESARTPRLSPKQRQPMTAEEILQQLREEGIVPESRPGGVAFHVGQDRLYFPAPPRRLTRLATPRKYTSYEKHLIADLNIYDKLVEQVQRKAIDRDTKIRQAHKKKASQQEVFSWRAEQKLKAKEEKMKRFEEEKEMKKKEKEEMKKEKMERKLKMAD